MAFHLVRIPDDAEFVFRCRTHSRGLKGEPAFERTGAAVNGFHTVSYGKMTCLSGGDSCADSWEMFYREEH